MAGANIFDLKDVRENEPISAGEYNKLVAIVRQLSQVMLPGMFRTGAFLVQRPVAGGVGSSTTDLVIGIWQESVLAATTTAKADREEGSCKFYELASGGLIETATGENPQPVGFSTGNVGLFQRITTDGETRYIYFVPWCGFLAGSDDE